MQAQNQIKSFRSKHSSLDTLTVGENKGLRRGSESYTSRASRPSKKFQPGYKMRQKSSTLFEQSTRHPRYLISTDWDQEKWVVRDKVFKDQADWSRHPSYTIKNISYHLECEQRYLKNTEKYNAQLQREMEYFIASKLRGYDQYFTKRILSYTTYWPPLHTSSELDIFTKRFFQLTPPQKKRLNFLMETELSFI